MWQLIKFEFEKIWSRNIVWIGLAVMLAAGLVVSNSGNSSRVVTSDGIELKGKEGKEYIREHTEKYAGLLNDEKLKQITEEERPGGDDEYASYHGLPLYRALYENFGRDYGPFYGMTVDQAFTQKGITVEVGYSEPWVGVLNSFPIILLGIGTVVAIAISGVFAEEYSRKMDALLLTCRHGKKRCVYAKVIASFLFAVIAYAAFALVYLIPAFAYNGFYGLDAGIQLDDMGVMAGVPYTLSCGQAVGLMLAGGLMGMLMLTAVTLVVSVISQSSFVAVIIAALLYYLPLIFLQVLDVQILALTPFGAALNTVLLQPKISIGGVEVLFYAKILVTVVILAVIAWAATRRIFARHQVR